MQVVDGVKLFAPAVLIAGKMPALPASDAGSYFKVLRFVGFAKSVSASGELYSMDS